MIKRYLLFYLILIAPILSISQTTSDSIKISSEQLKITNLIFAEHAKLSNQVLLLENQIRNLEKVDSIWLHTDSIRREQVTQYEQVIQQQENKLNKIKKWSIFKNYIFSKFCIKYFANNDSFDLNASVLRYRYPNIHKITNNIKTIDIPNNTILFFLGIISLPSFV